ncbi:MAG: hypothetical protein QF451_06170, partial [Nitrospinota bacterium]|nr:hypothetical protein [Nitrospinota bacterium]
RDALALGKQHFGFSQPGYDLLRCMTLLAHANPPRLGSLTERVSKILSFSMDRFGGGRSIKCRFKLGFFALS